MRCLFAIAPLGWVLLAGCSSGPDPRYTFQSPDLPPSEFTGGVFPAETTEAAPVRAVSKSRSPSIVTADHENQFSLPPAKRIAPRGDEAWKIAGPSTPNPAAANPAAEVTPMPHTPANVESVSIQPARVLNGRVAIVNAKAGVCAINFPIGQLPALDSTLTVYRHGVRVGEIKITGPQRDDNIVAEILSGEIQPGDEARNR